MRPHWAMPEGFGKQGLISFHPSLLLQLSFLTLKRSYLEFDEEQECTSISCPRGGRALISIPAGASNRNDGCHLLNFIYKE